MLSDNNANLTPSEEEKGKVVDINDVKITLEKMGVELTEKQCLELVRNLPFADDDKIYQNRLIEGVKSLKVHKKISLETLMNKVKAFIGEKVDSRDLKNVLGSLGIELTDDEQEKLLKTLPVDGGNVHVNNLDNTQENLGLKLTEEELVKLSENLQVDAKGNVDLKEVMDGVKATTADGKVYHNRLLKDIKSFKASATDYVSLANGNVDLHNMIEGVKAITESLNLLHKHVFFDKGKVDVKNLETILGNMRIKLTDKELEDLTQNLPVTGEHVRYHGF
nr:uncharacterized protein LOC131275137 [Dasypus novemcinctus]